MDGVGIARAAASGETILGAGDVCGPAGPFSLAAPPARSSPSAIARESASVTTLEASASRRADLSNGDRADAAVEDDASSPPRPAAAYASADPTFDRDVANGCPSGGR